jgi:hypothetical protein
MASPAKRMKDELKSCKKRLSSQSGDMVLFHGTCDKYAKLIAENGLRDAYLTSEYELAEMFADIKAEYDDCKPVVLVVKVKDRSNLRVDSEHLFTSTAFIEGLYGIEDMHEWDALHDDGKIPVDDDDERDWLPSLCVLKSVRYEGTIPPNDIEVD